MSETVIYSPSDSFVTKTVLTETQYRAMYEKSLRDPRGFWAEQAEKCVTWFKRWDEVFSGSFREGDVTWFTNGKLNVSYNCLDRHLAIHSNKIAIYWEGDDPLESRHLTYQMLYEEVGKFANVLKKQGIKKNDIVCIYLPMIPEAVIVMLACARIGAVHSVVFGGFSSESLASRIQDANCQLVITANEGLRGGKKIPLKKNVDTALKHCPSVKKVIVVKRTSEETPWVTKRDVWFHEEMAEISSACPAILLDADDPLFILYTSGSTGKPKGILHTQGGYLVYVAMTFRYVFDYQENDIFWCTADIGWITGHSYGVYGPLSQGASIVLFEGIPTYPSASRYWEIIDKYHVTTFYTAPTAIRALRREGDECLLSTTRDSLRLLGSVGEPINPATWEWYYRVVGKAKCPIVDTWWQTETGGILISPLPGATQLKPGAAAWPMFGIVPDIFDENGQPLPEGKMGQLVITQPWPGMMKTIYGDKKRFIENYFSVYPNCYLTGDTAYRDQENYYYILGRSDDVIKVSGHRIGTEEVESALVSDQRVVEAAVVARPDDIKGESIYAFVILQSGIPSSKKIQAALVQHVREKIGPIATPDYIQIVDALPKTRSGKIMRRILRKIANNDLETLGDLSTLTDKQVIESLIEGRKLVKDKMHD